MKKKNILKRISDRFWGQGEASVTVPIMDGPLKPNQALEEAPLFAKIGAPDSMVQRNGSLFVASGSSVMYFEDIKESTLPKILHDFGEHNVTCLDISPDGAFAAGLDGLGIKIIGGAYNGAQFNTCGSAPLICPTDLLFIGEDILIFAVGSQEHKASEWRHDLVKQGRSGSVWMADLKSGECRFLADKLAFPYGLAQDIKRQDRLLVSESWSSRIISVPLMKKNRSLSRVDLFEETNVQNLPGYPSRIQADREGDCYWVTVFAPRSQLIELILREKHFKERMMAEIKNPEYWIAPALSSMKSFLEPLQEGSVIKMGIRKPWAPPRSYGLIIKLNSDLNIVGSYHSRTDGRRHGILDTVRVGTQLFAASKGYDLICAVDLSVAN
jgi:hypothetical protein